MADAIGRKMNSMTNKFLWEGNRSNKKFRLVGWQVVTSAKEGSGLWIRNLRLQNKSIKACCVNGFGDLAGAKGQSGSK